MDYWPGWMTAELEARLRAIDAEGRTKDTRKKVETVLRLAEGMAQGKSETAILAEPETCAKSTWQGKGGRRNAQAWSRDGAIVAALELAQRLAVEWESRKVARALELAREQLALKSPAMVDRMEEAQEGLVALAGDADVAGGTRVRAWREVAQIAAEWLDRADVSTADKSGGDARKLVNLLAGLRELDDEE